MYSARLIVSIALLCAVWMGAAPASAAPQQLLNKTVTLSWSILAHVRDPEGRQAQVRNDIKYIIYISSLGRLFERSSRSLGEKTQSGDHQPDAVKTKLGETRGLRFEGNRLVAYRDFSGAGGSGGMRAIATFDSSYSSCTLATTSGRVNGGALRRKGFDGVVREVRIIGKSDLRCSIQDGNAFASR